MICFFFFLRNEYTNCGTDFEINRCIKFLLITEVVHYKINLYFGTTNQRII